MASNAVSAEPVRAKTQTIPMFPSAICLSTEPVSTLVRSIRFDLTVNVSIPRDGKKGFLASRHRTRGSAARGGTLSHEIKLFSRESLKRLEPAPQSRRMYV